MDTREMLIEADARRVADLVAQLKTIAQEHQWPLVCMAIVTNGENSAACLGTSHVNGQTMLDLLCGAGPMGHAVIEAASTIHAASTLMAAQRHFDEVIGEAPCECPNCLAKRVEESA